MSEKEIKWFYQGWYWISKLLDKRIGFWVSYKNIRSIERVFKLSVVLFATVLMFIAIEVQLMFLVWSDFILFYNKIKLIYIYIYLYISLIVSLQFQNSDPESGLQIRYNPESSSNPNLAHLEIINPELTLERFKTRLKTHLFREAYA